jgi:hypothetical protein
MFQILQKSHHKSANMKYDKQQDEDSDSDSDDDDDDEDKHFSHTRVSNLIYLFRNIHFHPRRTSGPKIKI